MAMGRPKKAMLLTPGQRDESEAMEKRSRVIGVFSLSFRSLFENGAL